MPIMQDPSLQSPSNRLAIMWKRNRQSLCRQVPQVSNHVLRQAEEAEKEE
jgi:hypothetical protein